MNSKLKKVIIIAIILMVLALGGVFLSMFASNSSNVIISNLCILETDGKIMKDKEVYIQNSSNNRFPIVVKMTTNGPSNGYVISSSNPNVANIKWIENQYFVEYYNAGTANIIVKSRDLPEINDKVRVVVHESYTNELKFVDSVNEETYLNELSVYADDLVHSYKFKLEGYNDNIEEKTLLEEVKYIISESIFENYDVKKVVLDTKNEKNIAKIEENT